MTDTNRLPGHELRGRDDIQGTAPAECACGEISEHVLSSKHIRAAWLQVHKDIVRAEIRAKVIEPPRQFPYMSLIPDRTPERKPHDSLGQARKAVLYRVKNDEVTVPCRIYSWSNKEGWKQLWDIPEGTKREELPWVITHSPKN